jgi:hypothetical protein
MSDPIEAARRELLEALSEARATLARVRAQTQPPPPMLGGARVGSEEEPADADR